MLAQFKKEINSLFNNMTGVTFAAIVLIFAGIFTTIINLKSGYPTLEYVFLESLFLFFFLVSIPVLTMRSFAEEKGNKTDQLLYSLPIGMPNIVMGKYLAMISVNAGVMAILGIYPIILSFYGEVNFLKTYSTLFAFFLLGCALIAIDMFISSLTESIVLSAIISIGVSALLFFVPWLAALIPAGAGVSLACIIIVSVICGLIVYLFIKNYIISAAVSACLIAASVITFVVNSTLFEGLFPTMLKSLALFNKLDAFAYNGIIDLSALVYLLSVSILFVFLTVRSMDKKRWS